MLFSVGGPFCLHHAILCCQAAGHHAPGLFSTVRILQFLCISTYEKPLFVKVVGLASPGVRAHPPGGGGQHGPVWVDTAVPDGGPAGGGGGAVGAVVAAAPPRDGQPGAGWGGGEEEAGGGGGEAAGQEVRVARHTKVVNVAALFGSIVHADCDTDISSLNCCS